MVARALVPAWAAVVAIWMVSTVLAFTVLPAHPQLGVPIAIDLTATAAATFWLLAVRPGHARPAALVRLLVVGFALARLLVGVRALGVAGIAIELAVMAFLVVRMRRLVRRMRALRREGNGLPAALELALRDVLPVPMLASVLAVEISTVVFAVTGWFRSPPEGFAMHRRSGYLMFVGVICVLAVVEAVGMHLVLARVAPIAAIVMTALSAYSLLWLVGAAHAVRLSPLRVTERGLVIERGITRRALVPVDVIARAIPAASVPADAIDMSYVEPNVVLELAAPVDVHGLFGRMRRTSKLALSVDDRDAFFARLAQRVDDGVVDRTAQ